MDGDDPALRSKAEAASAEPGDAIGTRCSDATVPNRGAGRGSGNPASQVGGADPVPAADDSGAMPTATADDEAATMSLNGEDRQESDTLGGAPLPYDQVVAGASTGGAAGGSAADLAEERHKDQPVRGMAVRGEVRHITADRTQIHVRAVIGGRRFTGVVREAPAPRAVVGATEAQTAVTQPSVVVVGAGMAGLAAADELHALGCKVVVVDARDRIGGRCWTDDSLEGRTVDLGAGWIHGCQGNPVAELARRADAVPPPPPPPPSLPY